MREAWMALVAVATMTAGACTAFDTPDTYNRHRLSDITLPRGQEGSGSSDVFFFDVTVTAEFPDNDPKAEAERMKWLGEWMVQRHMCPTGYEIVKKRKFDYMEDNPAHRDLRYEARCKT